MPKKPAVCIVNPDWYSERIRGAIVVIGAFALSSLACVTAGHNKA